MPVTVVSTPAASSDRTMSGAWACETDGIGEDPEWEDLGDFGHGVEFISSAQDVVDDLLGIRAPPV